VNKRRALTPSEKASVRARQDQRCPKCQLPLEGRVEFNHRLALIFGGDNSLDNFEAVHQHCHRQDTTAVIKGHRKSLRIAKKRTGETKPKRKIKSRGFTQWLGMDGTIRRK
jgi:5-methylcytosine-specific restriction endonuclease McrA